MHSILARVWLAVEKMRLRRHLARALAWLRGRGSLSEARLEVLAHLQAYIKRGVFPVNLGSGYKPIFIDSLGTHCAVGFLVAWTAGAQAARELDRKFHFDYVLGRMKTDAQLCAWAEAHNLTLEELAFVQPGYFGLDHFIANFIVIGLLSLGLCVFFLACYPDGDLFSQLLRFGAIADAAAQALHFVLIFVYAKKTNAPLVTATMLNCLFMVYFIVVLALASAGETVYIWSWVLLGLFGCGVSLCLFPCTLLCFDVRDSDFYLPLEESQPAEVA